MVIKATVLLVIVILGLVALPLGALAAGPNDYREGTYVGCFSSVPGIDCQSAFARIKGVSPQQVKPPDTAVSTTVRPFTDFRIRICSKSIPFLRSLFTRVCQ